MTTAEIVNVNMLDEALEYARRGWSVFPLHTPTPEGCSCHDPDCKNVGKHPRTVGGVKDATTDEATVQRWWSMWPDANIGLACGASGVLALDLDSYKDAYDGDRLLTYWEQQTTTNLTGRGGQHLLYQMPEGELLGNKEGELPAGINVRGHNGYIVLPPSLHECGRRYEWEEGYGPHEMPPQPLPQKLYDILKAAQTSKGSKANFSDTPTEKPSLAQWKLSGRIVELIYDGQNSEDRSESDQSVIAALVSRGATDDEILSVFEHYPIGTAGKFADRGQDYLALSIGRARSYLEAKNQAQRVVDSATGEIVELLPQPTIHLKDNGNGHKPVVVVSEVDESEVDEPEVSNPLDVHPTANLDLGMVNEMAAIVTEMTLAPPEFGQIVALTTMATALSNVSLHMSWGVIRPNIYAAIIAMSSFYHKSTAIDMARVFLRKAQLKERLLFSQMTGEGLLSHLQGNPAGIVLNDEIGRIFSSHNVKYTANLKADLTDIYDGMDVVRALSKGMVKVESPYVNILGGTTPEDFHEGVTFKDWRSGFLARWLYVQPVSKPNLRAMAGTYTEDHDQRISKLADKLLLCSRQPQTKFAFKDDTFDIWFEWQLAGLEKALSYGDNVAAPLLVRINTYALKFAMILAVAHGQWGTITPETMQTAVALADNYKANAYQLLTEKTNFGISGGKLDRVLKAIFRLQAKEQDGWITTKKLQQNTSLSKSELVPCLEKLVEIGCADAQHAGKGFKYHATGKDLPVKSWR